MQKILILILLLGMLIISTNAYPETIQYDVSGSASFYYGSDFTSGEYSLEIVGYLTMSVDISESISLDIETDLNDPPGYTVTFESFYFEIGDQYVFQGTDASTYYATSLDYYARFYGSGDFNYWFIHRGEYAIGEFYTGPDYDTGVHTFAFPETFRLYSGDSYSYDGYSGGGTPYDVSLFCTRSPVPEPSTIILIGIGVTGLIGKRKFLKIK